MQNDKIYVGDMNFHDEVTAGEQFTKGIELVEITLREEVVYDVDLTVPTKVKLAKLLDDFGIPILQLHARGAKRVIDACREAGVRAKFEIVCRPYNPYGFEDWKAEIRSAIASGAEIIHPSITTPRKWEMGEAGMTIERVQKRAIEAFSFARDEGAQILFPSFTDVPRTDLSFIVETTAAAMEVGAVGVSLCDTVGVGKSSLWRYIVRRVKAETGAKIRVHLHDDFGLATANTLASLEAGAEQAEVVVNGADPARSGIAPLAEVTMALLCLYRIDLGYRTEMLTDLSRLFADETGMPIDEQMPVVADRNWMYKRDHIMRTITQDESIQFPFSPSLVGQSFQIGLGRGSGPVGIRAKLKQLGLEVPEERVPDLVSRVTAAAVERRRRLTDAEFIRLVAAT